MITSTRSVRRRLAPVLVAGVLLAACGTDDDTTTESPATATDDDMSESESSDDMSETEMASESEMSSEDHEGSDAPMSESEEDDTEAAAASNAPPVTATLADGSTVTLADYAGEQVFVETFATWCSNCRRQLNDTAVAAASAGDAATFLALSVETNLDPAALESYAAENGFDDITFGVLDDASLATLADTFGNAVLVPPSTPKFTVAADGNVSDLTTGFESADEILAQVDGA